MAGYSKKPYIYGMSKSQQIISRYKGLTKFKETYGEMTEKELQLEILRELQGQTEILQKTKSNTSMMVWWLIVIPIVLTIIFIVWIWIYS